MRRSLVESFPAADFAAALVFVDVLERDGVRTAAAASRRVTDPRVRTFHDPRRRAGRSMARTLGWQHHLAWDCYLFYPAGVRWEGPRMPPAAWWFHQLRNREIWESERPGASNAEWTSQIPERTEASPRRFRTGGGLVAALGHAASAMLAGTAPTAAERAAAGLRPARRR